MIMNSDVSNGQCTLELLHERERAPIAKQENIHFKDDEVSNDTSSKTQNSHAKPSSTHVENGINWLRDKSKPNEFKRWNIMDMVQENGSGNYDSSPIDEDSLLVKVECKKVGCRCVLKNEPALAMKIVSGVSLVQGTCISNQSNANFWNNSSGLSTFGDEVSSPNGLKVTNKSSWLECRSSSQISIASASSERNPCLKNGFNSKGTPLILTSCCPSWFELVQKTPINSLDDSPSVGAPLPVWTSGKSMWKVKPSLVIVRKETKCLLSCTTVDMTASMMSSQSFNNDSQGQGQPTLDADRWKVLRPGMIILILDCKVCQLFHSDTTNQGSAHQSNFTSSRNRLRTASMLQCSIVGAKSIKKVLQNSGLNLDRLSDALISVSDTNQYVYLPLDDKSVAFSPVAISPMLSGQFKQPLGSNRWFGNGVHSILSLLVNFRLPMLVKPVFGRSVTDWIPNQSSINQSDRHSPANSSKNSANCFLKLNASYHGTLIFLEPINDCVSSSNICDTNDGRVNVNGSRFFVVTLGMLNQHKFLVAERASRVQFVKKLRAHACRVAHFLAACHPLYGIAYLLRYMEDTTQYSSIGPCYFPLSRTLGPPGAAGPSTVASLSAIASVSAITAIALGDLDLVGKAANFQLYRHHYEEDNSEFDTCKVSKYKMYEILNEIDDIYCYVRSGRFPENSKFYCSTLQGTKQRSRSVADHNATITKHGHGFKQIGNDVSTTGHIVFQEGSKMQNPPSSKNHHFRQKSAELKSTLSHCLPMFMSGSNQQNSYKNDSANNDNHVISSNHESHQWPNMHSNTSRVAKQSKCNVLVNRNTKLSPVVTSSQHNPSPTSLMKSKSNDMPAFTQSQNSISRLGYDAAGTTLKIVQQSPLASSVSISNNHNCPHELISPSANCATPLYEMSGGRRPAGGPMNFQNNDGHSYEQRIVVLQPKSRSATSFSPVQTNLFTTDKQCTNILVPNRSVKQQVIELVPVNFTNNINDGTASVPDSNLMKPCMISSKPQYADFINLSMGHGNSHNIICNADTIEKSISDSMMAEVNQSVDNTAFRCARRLESGPSSIGSIAGHMGQQISTALGSPYAEDSMKRSKVLSPHSRDASNEASFSGQYRTLPNTTPLPLIQPHLNFVGFKQSKNKHNSLQAFLSSNTPSRVTERMNSSPDTGFGAESIPNGTPKHNNSVWTPQMRRLKTSSGNHLVETPLDESTLIGQTPSLKSQRMYIL